jgi:hypothetical protein
VGVLVSTVLFGMDLCGVGHETAGVQSVRLRQQCVMSPLGMIAKLVPLGRELVIIGCSPVVFGCFQMRLHGWVGGHGCSLPFM